MIKIFSTGGTIDKIYFDAKSEFQVGEPHIDEIFRDAFINLEYEVESIMRKDSLEMTAGDRALIRERIEQTPHRQIIVTHGTDTMVETGRALLEIAGKTIVLVGAMQPASLRKSDAIVRHGKISKQGSRYLRGAMVQAATVAYRLSSRWGRVHDRIAKRCGRKGAKTALARHMLTVIYYMLKRNESFQEDYPRGA